VRCPREEKLLELARQTPEYQKLVEEAEVKDKRI
jgi:hypothetical protein